MQQRVASGQIDAIALDRAIGEATFVLITVPRRTDVQAYINLKMQSLRRLKDRNLVIDYVGLTQSWTNEMKLAYPDLFVDQDAENTPYEQRILVMDEVLHFRAENVAELLRHNYREIYLFTSLPTANHITNRLHHALVATGCLCLDAIVRPVPGPII